MKNFFIEYIQFLYKFIKSLKLTVIIIIYIVIFSIIATLIPQGMASTFYENSYNKVISQLILYTGFNNFFKSLLFIVPMVLFVLNLSVCTVNRIIKRSRNKAKRRFGPDIIHIGFLILIIGGLITFLTREEGFAYLKVGDSLKINDDISLYLTDYQYLTYSNSKWENIPKAWLSTVDVIKDDEVIKTFTIEVNKPLKIDSLTIYQSSFSNQDIITLANRNGDKFDINSGQGLKINENTSIFFIKKELNDNNEKIAIFQEIKNIYNDEGEDDIEINYIRYKTGNSIGEYLIIDIFKEEFTGLLFVKDEGFLPFMISSIIIMIGLALTFIQKIGDNKLL